MIDSDLVKTAALVVNLLANFIIGFFVMLDRRERVGMEAIEKLEQETNKKLDALKDTIKNGSEKHDSEIIALHKRTDLILSSTSEINHELGLLSGSLDHGIKSLTNQVTLILDSLINRSHKND